MADTTKGCKKDNCQWCAKGECWSAGQIERPARTAKGGGRQNGGRHNGGRGQKAGGGANNLMNMLAGSGGSPNPQKFMAMLMGFMGQQGFGGEEEVSPKQVLMDAHTKALGRSAKIGEDVSYETNEVTEEGSKKQQFQSQVTVGGATFAGEVAISKKEAEKNASRVALNDLYPGALDAAQPTMKVAQTKGTKRKGAPTDEEQNPKNKLGKMIAITKGSISKDDMGIVFEESPGACNCTITLPHFNVTASGTGANKKAAEAAAVEAALEDPTFKAQYEAAEAEHTVKKQAKREAERATRDAKREAKKAKKLE